MAKEKVLAVKIRAPQLSPRERKAVQARIKAHLNGLPLLDVAQDVFPNQTPGSARVSLTRTLQKATLKEAVEAEFDRLGINLTDILQPIKDGLQATAVVHVDSPHRHRGESDEDFEERLARQDFVVSRPDHGTRLRAADMAARFLGVGRPPKEDGNDAPAGIVFNVQNNYIKGK